MPTCKKCGAEIAFKPHPKNPGRLAPFDQSGEIHFATCKSKPPKRIYRSVGEWRCKADHPGKFFHLNAKGQLLAWCGDMKCFQMFVPDTPENRSLVNIDKSPKDAYYKRST